MPSRRVPVDVLTELIQVLSARGRAGRELAVRLDLVRATGLRYPLHRAREDRALARLVQRGGLTSRYRKIWGEAARELGADVVELDGGFIELRRDSARTRVWNHWVPLDDIVTARLALDKTLVHRLLSSSSLPVPAHLEFDATDAARAIAFLESADSPCVVKPVGASGGGGTTSGITRRADLVRAAARAGRLGGRVLIERQARGDVYRLLLLDGELLDVVRRRPPTVTGDGRSTIAALVAVENRRRLAEGGMIPLLRLDLDSAFALGARGLRLSSVPSAGDRVSVKTVVSQNAPEDNETVEGDVSPTLARDAARAAGAVGLRLAGVDVITPSTAASLSEAGGVVLEVNGTPGLHYHYEVRNRERATPVAVPILRKLLEG